MLKRGLKAVLIGSAGGIIVYAAFILFILPGGWRAYVEKRRDFEQLYLYNVGEHFIDIDFRRLDGHKTRLSRYPHKVALINFFTSSSDSSNEETPFLEQLSERYRDRGFFLAAVDVNESASKAQAYRRKHNLTFPVWLVADKVEGGFIIPFNLVIDEEGVVRFASSGERPRELETIVAGLLAR